MSFQTWSLFVLTIIAASISPGPNVLLTIVNTLKHGLRGAAFTVLGNLSALFFIASLAAIGVGALIKTLPLAYTTMKWIGGAYLMWMGFKLIKNSLKPNQTSDSYPQSPNLKSPDKFAAKGIFFQAIAVSASNPKAILFLTAIFPQFLSIDKPITPQFTIMFASIMLVVTLIHGGYAWSSLWFKKRSISFITRKWLSRLTGGIFITLGLAVALDK